jgi:hypothetical protein
MHVLIPALAKAHDQKVSIYIREVTYPVVMKDSITIALPIVE